MSTEALAIIVAAVISLVSSIYSAHTNNKSNNTMLQVKNQLLQFENTFVDRLNGRYLRKPELDEDYPASRKDMNAMDTIVERLRKWREHDYNNDRQTDRAFMLTRVIRLEAKMKIEDKDV